MASSIIGGLIEQGHQPSTITVCDPNTSALEKLAAGFGIATTEDNQSASKECDVLILAVKPQILRQVVETLTETLKSRSQAPLIISIAAGISSAQIINWLGFTAPIVRCMPNTPALVQQGASGLYANDETNDEQKALAQSLLNAVGYSIWVRDEQLIDAITAVSGSGPAYFFLMMEAMIEAGIKQGLNPEDAATLTLQTALGAATLAQSSDVAVDELRRRVTSPGGTTERAIEHFEQAGLRTIIDAGMKACADRSREMAKDFD